MKNRSTFFLAALLTALFGTCTRRSAEPVRPLEVLEKTDASLVPTWVPLPDAPTPPTRNQPEFVFDWETATVMPHPPTTLPIPIPWSDQARRAFGESVRYDYKKSDGWELVYNTFSNRLAGAGTNGFLLYNPYRGVLRFYFYLAGNTQNVQGHNALTHKITTYGTFAPASPLLNFADQSVVDVEKNSRFAATIGPQAPRDRTWYLVEYELAFDSRLSEQRFETFALQYALSTTQTEAVLINGQSSPVLPVSLRREGVDWTAPIQLGFLGPLRLIISGTDEVDRLAPALGGSADTLRRSVAHQSATSLSNAVLASGSSLISWEATGTLVPVRGKSAGVATPQFALPGYDNLQAAGITPQYNEPPGVFYLEKRPLVTTQTRTETRPTHVYTLDVPSVRYVFNPALTRVANIRNLTQVVVAYAASSAEEILMRKRFRGTSLESNEPLTVEGVRVSFDVVPRNGGPVVHHVKTFRADVQSR